MTAERLRQAAAKVRETANDAFWTYSADHPKAGQCVPWEEDWGADPGDQAHPLRGVRMIRLTWDRPPLSLNDRQHHHVKAKAYAQAVEDARWAIRRDRPRVDSLPVAVGLHWRIPDKRRRDPDNLAGTLKAVLDALVAESVLPDDGWQYVRRVSCEMHPPDGDPAMWVTLEGAV